MILLLFSFLFFGKTNNGGKKDCALKTLAEKLQLKSENLSRTSHIDSR